MAIIFLLFITSSITSVEGRKHHVKKGKTHKHKKDKNNKGNSTAPDSSPAPASLPGYGYYPTGSNIFDVLSFGAKGDGVSDDSKVKSMVQTAKSLLRE